MDAGSENRSPFLRHLLGFAEALVPELNFITLHYAYFITIILLSALIFWGAATPFRSVSFIDALFLTTSAMTETGLNTVNLSKINTFQQFMLMFLILIGSAIFVSIGVIFVRLRAFEKEFQRNIRARRDEKNKMKAEMKENGFNRSKSIFIRAPGRVFSQDKDKEDGDTGETELKKERSKEATTTVSPTAAADDHERGNDISEESSSGTSSSSDQRPQLALQIDGVRDRGPDRTVAFELSPTARSPTVREGHTIMSPGAQITSPGAQLSTQRSNSSWSHSSRNAGNRRERMRPPIFSFTGVGATSRGLRPRSYDLKRSTSKHTLDVMPETPFLKRTMTTTGKATTPWFASATGYFTRNSEVHGLTLEERQDLGGREYSAIVFLAFIVPFYWFVWQFFGAIAIGAWVKNHRAYLAEANGVNAFWVGAFTGVSAFGNAGMMLLDANMVAFQDSVFMLLSLGLFILAGNTMYPVFLRMAIWGIWKALPDDDFWKFDKETLRFLLDHPRRCYTNLFPKRHTWWLGLSVFVLNGIDWAFYPILNIGNNAITKIDPGLEVVDGLFQSLAVRAGGFYVVSLSSIRISLQVLYLVMMYISAYPVAITMRNSNVYEERSLGIFAEDQQEGETSTSPTNTSYDTATKAGLVKRHQAPSKEKSSLSMKSPMPFGGLKRTFTIAAQAPRRENHSTFVRQQIRAQLSHDAWWICLAVFLIAIIEGGRFESNPTVFSAFNIMFEVVSGYACVGMSIGVPWDAYSFCGAWHGLSKLVMVAVMLRGRHRGLPVAIDHAVQLPGTKQWEAEEEDGRVRNERSFTLREGQV